MPDVRRCPVVSCGCRAASQERAAKVGPQAGIPAQLVAEAPRVAVDVRKTKARGPRGRSDAAEKVCERRNCCQLGVLGRVLASCMQLWTPRGAYAVLSARRVRHEQKQNVGVKQAKLAVAQLATASIGKVRNTTALATAALRRL